MNFNQMEQIQGGFTEITEMEWEQLSEAERSKACQYGKWIAYGAGALAFGGAIGALIFGPTAIVIGLGVNIRC